MRSEPPLVEDSYELWWTGDGPDSLVQAPLFRAEGGWYLAPGNAGQQLADAYLGTSAGSAALVRTSERLPDGEHIWDFYRRRFPALAVIVL